MRSTALPVLAGGPGVVAAQPVLEDGTSVALFVALTVAVSVAAAVVVPLALRRLPLKAAVAALALVGPLLVVVGSCIFAGAMVLSGNDIRYVLLVAATTGAAAAVVGLRLARPMAGDLDRVAATVEAVAAGDRGARVGIRRSGEIGRLADAVDHLGRSLARAETERAAADDERRSVVSALSHDLRTPLASLLASVDALADDIGDPEVHLRAMRGNVLALEALVGDLFLLARADSGSLALGAERLDLAELVDEAVEAVEPVASRRSVTVRVDGPGPLPVIGDHQALARVLRNLLDNAIRHSPAGGEVRVTCGSADTGAVIDVIDDGPGFAPELVGRAFERFVQGDAARHRPGAAGLGLAIAHTLVDAHEGSIAIVPGGGGRVRVSLPLVRSHGHEQRSIEARSVLEQ